ncbi:lactate/malate dehydrogenase, NAD binding domain-containing protein [Phthorimaea operculella]|nr:lactate/malate dehydrogenase, NAD binding domain-containing protein [Phthorimaea operculella]
MFLRNLAVVCLGAGRQLASATGARVAKNIVGWKGNLLCPVCKHVRFYGSGCEGMKVCICGAGGCTGQPLALLLKQCQLIDEVALYDQTPICGFGVELSHVDTKPKVSSYSGKHTLCDALCGATVVVILARNTCDTFEANAPVITEIALQICNTCPTCVTIVGTEPVESMVPLIAEIQRLRNCYNPRRLLGCVELNCVRANTVLADFLRMPPEAVRVPVIGGATPRTMVPVLSLTCQPCAMTQEQVECVTSCIMSGTEAVCQAKGCSTATPCLAGAYALARVTTNVVKALQGTKTTQCAYVDSLGTCAPDCQFFSTDVLLGPSGIEQVMGVPELSKFENCLLCNALPYIRNEQSRAVWLVYSMCQQCCCPTCNVHPCTCNDLPRCPCVPPTNWTCDYPDACRDAYLASICREMSCQCGSTELCWRPKECDVACVRAASMSHMMPVKHKPCSLFDVPPSVEVRRQKARNPCACK